MVVVVVVIAFVLAGVDVPINGEDEGRRCRAGIVSEVGVSEDEPRSRLGKSEAQHDEPLVGVCCHRLITHGGLR